MEPWSAQIRELAKAPHVLCKVSGMVTEARHHAWHAEDFRPYLDLVFECFGPDRLMYGSDWPLVPMKPGTVRSFVDTVRSVCPRHGIEPLITLTSKRCCQSSSLMVPKSLLS